MNITIQDIVKNDLCTGCGLCISESKSSKMIWDGNGFLVPDLSGTFSSNAIKLCPFNPSPDLEVENEDKLASIYFPSTTNVDDRVGRFENIYVGYAKKFRKTSSSGGMATYIFEELLKERIVDHLFVVKEVNGTYEYQWFDSISQIKMISKTRYIPVTLENLFKEIDGKEGKVAVSGVACFLKAIRLKQYYFPEYREKIPFLVGIICGGLKSRFFTDYMANKAGINGAYSRQDYRIKDHDSYALDYSFGAYSSNDVWHALKMKKVGDMWGTGYFKSHACDFCTDVASELADISLGDAWIDPYKNDGSGTSVIITRSYFAEKLIRKGENNKALIIKHLSVDGFKLSQSGSLNHRQIGVKYRVDYFKNKQKLIPFVRPKFFKSIPREYKMVQKARLQIRAKSFRIWQEYKNSLQYDSAILPDYNKLKKKTIFYHRIQRLKAKLGLNTLKV
jgi:coenzyme F420 hydrogenase subunit beta